MVGWKDRAARGGMVAVEREEAHTQLTDSTKMSPVTLHVWIPWLSYITCIDLFLSSKLTATSSLLLFTQAN